MLNHKKTNLKTKKYNHLILNGVLVFLSSILLLLIFSKGKQLIEVDYIYTISYISTLILPTIILVYLYIPRFLKKEKYIIFVAFSILTIIVYTLFQRYCFTNIINYIFPNHFFNDYPNIVTSVIIFTVFYITVTLYRITRDWFYYNKKENNILKKKNTQIENKLSTLRAQINPHFLFNSLNVIYSLALENKKETTDAILKLSEILRYILYDANTKKITLKEELKLINNYISFQKFRIQKFENIDIQIKIRDDSYKIYPMLLMPLIENSFKFGIKENIKEAYVRLLIEQKDELFFFKIENSIHNKPTENIKKNYSGIGLDNVKKNLLIIYPHKHEFKIIKSKHSFIVELKIYK